MGIQNLKSDLTNECSIDLNSTGSNPHGHKFIFFFIGFFQIFLLLCLSVYYEVYVLKIDCYQLQLNRFESWGSQIYFFNFFHWFVFNFFYYVYLSIMKFLFLKLTAIDHNSTGSNPGCPKLIFLVLFTGFFKTLIYCVC